MVGWNLFLNLVLRWNLLELTSLSKARVEQQLQSRGGNNQDNAAQKKVTTLGRFKEIDFELLYSPSIKTFFMIHKMDDPVAEIGSVHTFRMKKLGGQIICKLLTK